MSGTTPRRAASKRPIAISRRPSGSRPSWVSPPCAGSWATAGLPAARLGDRRGASALYGLLARYSDQFVFAYGGAWGAVAHYLGLLAATLDRFDEAEAHFDAAAETHERIGAPTWLARTRFEWAAML